MTTSSTQWRIPLWAWPIIGIAILGEVGANAIRAYGLGTHLDRFTITIHGHAVSLAGGVLVLAAVAISLSQARAAWVALTPIAPARQRIVSGLAAALLLAISVTAMASHILDAQRARSADEGGARASYDRAEAAYKLASAELAGLGNPRPAPVIQTDVVATKIDMATWRRSQQCSDISRDDTKSACEPILALYKERGAAARKAELAPEVARLRAELAKLERPEEIGAAETAVAIWWAWIMGLGVVFVATFGTVIFATQAAPRVEHPAPKLAALDLRLAAPIETVIEAEPEDEQPTCQKSKRECLADLLTLTALGRDIPSQEHLRERWGMAHKGTVSKWLKEWEDQGLITRVQSDRCKVVSA